MVGGADDPLRLHSLDDAGGAVVADLEMALDEAGRGLALAADQRDGAIIEIVARAALAPIGLDDDGDSGDLLYRQAVALVRRERKASTSFVQRHLQIGYNRAARIIERMEAEGVVSAANHVGKREVLGAGE